MGYRKFREAKQHLRNYTSPADWKDGWRPDDVDLAAGELVTVGELSAMTGCGKLTIKRFANNGTIPAPIGVDRDGQPVFDLDDERLSEWVSALRGAGYHVPARAG